MFITQNMTPGEMLAELFKGRRVSSYATDVFAELRHDKDLCPRIAKQISVMLDVYRAYGNEVHDIQSPRDDGIDILFRYEDKNGNERRAGIQIKSEDEFRQWEAGKLPLAQILKSQHASAMANVRLDEYYIILCVDAVRHQRRIRSICSELKNFRPATIIEPIDIFDFYEMSSIDVWARATRLLCHNDTVLKKATEEIEAEVSDVAFFMVDFVCRALGDSYDVDNNYLFQLWSEWVELNDNVDEDRDRLAEILVDFTNNGIIEYNGVSYTLHVSQLPKGLCALYFDLCVRTPDNSINMREKIIKLLDMDVSLDEKDEIEQ